MKFTSYLAGYPGSCHNSYVFSNMQISQQPEKFFDQNQFLLADSAYTSDLLTFPAYKGKELIDHQDVDFNYHLAQSRVRIEHAIEMKDIIKWIISWADLKDQWNELYMKKRSLIQLLWLRTKLTTQTMGY
ncbi:hypothetical protein VP01_8190g2, partial [Puccinia sorghi]